MFERKARAPADDRGAQNAGTSPAPAADASSGESLGKSYAITLFGNAAMIVFNVYTGVITARILSPDGRGAVGAIAGWVIVVTVMSGLGCRDGFAWLEAKSARLAPQVLTVSVTSVFVTSVVGIALAQLVIPWGFAAQSSEVVGYARIFMVWVIPYSASHAFMGLLAARHRFVSATVMRIGQPLLSAFLLTVLWIAGSATVFSVLIAQVASFAIPSLAAFVSLARESGMKRFDRTVLRDGIIFGVKIFGSSFGSLANARLDLMILPALVASSDIGLYVVAVSASTMIVGLFGSLQVVVFPAVARLDGVEAIQVTYRALRVVSTAALVSALALAVTAPFLIRLLYGSEFDGSVTPLLLLLPGVVFLATAQIANSGLSGLGYPTGASVAEFCGLVATVVGLVVLLPPLGIRGAAIASSASYFLVCVVGIGLLARRTRAPVRTIFNPRLLSIDVRWAWARLTAIRDRLSPSRRDSGVS